MKVSIDFGGLIVLAFLAFGVLAFGVLVFLAVGLLCAEPHDLMAVLAELCGEDLAERFLRCEFCDEDPHRHVRDVA